MKVAGIIAEYNPFHNGHRYHLDQAREVTGADYCIVVMSGNFTQRGEPALMDKYLRTRMALENGADLVLELPVSSACASASGFADGAVTLLHRLGVVDFLVFGSECGDVSLLKEAASILAAEPANYKKMLKNLLRAGQSYPAARSAALLSYLQEETVNSRLYLEHPTSISTLLSSPNNILGIEYCKSLTGCNSSTEPVTIRRSGGQYLDSDLSGGDKSSALAIRNACLRDGFPGNIWPYVPENVYDLMEQEYGKTFPVVPETLSQMLHYKLLTEVENGFSGYLDITPDLSDRIRKYIPEYQGFTSFCQLLKSKDMTYTRISRCLLHILLQIPADIPVAASYAKILGFRTDATPLLTAIKANTAVPLISKLADADRLLDEAALQQLKKDVLSTRIYHALVLQACGTRLPDETRTPIVRI